MPLTSLHEAVHVAIPPLENGWKYEGICEYLGQVISPESINGEDIVWMMDTDTEELNGAFQEIKAIYSSICGGDIDIDLRAYYDAVAAYTMKNSNNLDGIPKHLKTTMYQHFANGGMPEGNDLTYPSACSFIMFLEKKYSLEKVLDYCRTTSDFASVFGTDFESAHREWESYLEGILQGVK